MKEKNHKYIRMLIIILNLISCMALIGSGYLMRHKIARKVNEITERPIIELNMSMEEKMKDFEYLYNCIATSLPLDTLSGIEKQYGIDFVGRHDLYKEMIADTETDLDFYAVMNAIMEDVPTFHTDIPYPDYDYYGTFGCWNIEEVLSTRGIKNKSVYWNTLMRDSCTELYELSIISNKFHYQSYTGEYCAENGDVLLEIDGIAVDDYIDRTMVQPIKYDYINQKAFRRWLTFCAEPYSDAMAVPVTIKFRDEKGTIHESQVYMDVVASVLDGYSRALGVKKKEQKPISVADDMFYSYYDSENEILYLNIGQIDKWTMQSVADTLKDIKCTDIILDIRNNFGGNFDYVAMYLYPYLYGDDLEINHTWYLPNTKYAKKIVSNWKASRQLALKKSDYVAENGLGQSQDYLVSEEITRLTGGMNVPEDMNVYVLISGETGSAADRLALVLKDCKNATLIGTNTAGEGRMSSFLMDYLPSSGLVFIYMPELAYNIDGTNNAVVGTAPHIYVKEREPEEMENGTDNIDMYTYENRLLWDDVLRRAVQEIQVGRLP